MRGLTEVYVGLAVGGSLLPKGLSWFVIAVILPTKRAGGARTIAMGTKSTTEIRKNLSGLEIASLVAEECTQRRSDYTATTHMSSTMWNVDLSCIVEGLPQLKRKRMISHQSRVPA